MINVDDNKYNATSFYHQTKQCHLSLSKFKPFELIYRGMRTFNYDFYPLDYVKGPEGFAIYQPSVRNPYFRECQKDWDVKEKKFGDVCHEVNYNEWGYVSLCCSCFKPIANQKDNELRDRRRRTPEWYTLMIILVSITLSRVKTIDTLSEYIISGM